MQIRTILMDRNVQVDIMPRDGQKLKILTALQEGKRLTACNSMMDLGIGPLHQRVKELRDLGWPISRREVVVNGKRIAEFWMEKKQ